jgi:L-seryl-tRNA(Ser) seleniumtransferase
MEHSKSVINATGWIFSSKIGRAVWAPSAMDAGHAAVGEPHLPSPKLIGSLEAASPIVRCETYIKQLTGAEAAIVTSSNAGAALLILNEFAHKKQAILSRGEFIEVSSRFNIQDIANTAGANLVEIGSTNRVHISDYKKAITENTGLILKMQQLNYRVEGDAYSINPSQLTNLALKENTRRRKLVSKLDDKKPFKVLVYANQGSGILRSTNALGRPSELSVKDYIDAGCDLVSCSCDLLLGGPRAGIIAGSKRAISSLVRNPLSYILKPSNAAAAALARTLELYTNEDKSALEIPTCRMLTTSEGMLKKRAERLSGLLEATIDLSKALISITRASVNVGDDVLPLYKLDTYKVIVSPADKDPYKLINYLQNGTNPHIITLRHQDSVSIDMRTIDDSDLGHITKALLDYFS